MAEPFLGEIRICSFGFAPKGWALCNGQLLPINQNQALFALLGTTYGGDGRTTFALPDMRGRRPLMRGQNAYPLGEKAGSDSHTLTAQEIPAHTHAMKASTALGSQSSPENGYLAASNVDVPYTAASGAVVGGNASAVKYLGSTAQPHENRPPFLVLNFAIALQGIFPSAN